MMMINSDNDDNDDDDDDDVTKRLNKAKQLIQWNTVDYTM